MSLRMVGAIVLVSLLMMVVLALGQPRTSGEEAFVDGPLGPAMIQAPDLAQPIDVNETNEP